MSHTDYDPAKAAGSTEFHTEFCPCCRAVGPAGTTTNIEHDEKAMQEQRLQGVISYHRQAELGSDHDSHKQGIYTTNSVGDND